SCCPGVGPGRQSGGHGRRHPVLRPTADFHPPVRAGITGHDGQPNLPFWSNTIMTITTIFTRTLVAATLSIMAASSNAAAPDNPVGQYVDSQGNIGSFVQWTPDVAVTAGQRLADDALYESPCLDVQFFRHQGKPVQWANAKDGDAVSAEGNTTRRAVPTGAALVVPARMEVVPIAVAGEISGRAGTDAECDIEYQGM